MFAVRHVRGVLPRSESQAVRRGNGVTLYDAPVYPYTSTFQSHNLELTVRSPRVHVEAHKFVGQSIPIFNGKDSVGGTVAASLPATISEDYQLVIAIQGAFFWTCPQKEEPQRLPLASPLPKRIEHVFLNSSVTIPLATASGNSSMRRTASIRSILQDGLRKTLLRRSDPIRTRHEKAEASRVPDAHADVSKRTFHSFAFPLPRFVDREIPRTICVSRVQPSGPRGRWYAEGVQVAYTLTAHLQPVCSDDAAPSPEEYKLEVPIFIDSEARGDFDPPRKTWSKTALVTVKPLAFECALFLPQPASFARSGSIPFYLYFTTSPKSNTLARRIMRHAHIRVALVRRLSLDVGVAISAPVPRSRVSDEGPSSKRRRTLLRRVATSTPMLFGWPRRSSAKAKAKAKAKAAAEAKSPGSTSGVETQPPPAQYRPLPTLPPEWFGSYEDAVDSVTSEGFKKRVSGKETIALPGLGAAGNDFTLIPDGLFKGELQLRNELSNTIDWPGLSLSYFVEATVLFENEVLRTQHIVRVAGPYNE